MGSTVYREASVNASIDSLQKKGKLSAVSAKALQHGSNRTIKVPPLDKMYHDPVFSCFLIDASGSMDAYRQAVIDSHPVMLDALRGSAKCNQGALLVGQYLFNTEPHPLHPFITLGMQFGSDGIAPLNAHNYQPGGMTALYKTVYLLLQDLAAVMEHCATGNVIPTFTIGLITDGEDTEKGVNPADIRRFLDELRNGKHLLSSVIVGLTNNKFTPETLEQIRSTLGFDQAIPVTQSPRNIRRAFMLASQSSAAAHAKVRS